mmetsp:Transcript_11442/g.28926  ORF Transcript_11442/g.28926 Transcript_11442/m.28926 type:complete len:392 (+) Transcript_11442:90-1265(+)|eukprot:CAMPEP_0116093726 /NCGR_PEP_ID=MMETSP0327-20121206/8751_1 /TAXON_ID=44447 /ORGANISM="Pseudo-nitzschia delicatissima, Strain B596" /LENGTH=391 /DNA_ID=CAMNT_0003585281 /DNA_START=26 /DNA_END=1201 /DNA_ORIENTATION=+
MATFHERLHQAISEYGGKYDPVMRRSFQTVLMFEANRCLKDKLPALRPFQRKLAVFDQAKYLLEEISGETSLVGLKTRVRQEEIMWRTGTSKESLNPESMWSRATRLTKDVEKVAEQVREFIKEKLADSNNKKIKESSTHDEVYRLFVEDTYDKAHPNVTPGSEKYPIQFEYTHSHLFLAYKMYYRKGKLDPDFPKPREREIVVPKERPAGGLESYGMIAPSSTTTNKISRRTNSKQARASAGTVTLTESPLIVAAGQKASAAAELRVRSNLPLENGVCGSSEDLVTSQETLQETNERRRRELLREVKDHMDLLHQFEGIIDSDTIKKRKRDLFHSLPPPPPPHEEENGKKMKATTSGEKKGTSSETESETGKNADENTSTEVVSAKQRYV